ncbi:uncharacterized protein G2W53_027522 [Senna tora]|uniref:Uncharacterized protein n=1 Tax=Senna tora TaxID=362788 RepID=A0A834WGP4_9FABA|nr:uncharacterized protein G2W53_027522 [Senna tora]
MINVPEVAYQEDEICEQYEVSIDNEDVNLCGDVGEGGVVEVIETEVDGMARGEGRGTITGVGRGGRGRNLSQNGGSFNDEIEETPIEVPVEVDDGENHVEEYVHQPTSNDHPNKEFKVEEEWLKGCIVGADGCSSIAFYTVISALTQRCLVLEEEVKNVTQEIDASQERAVILEEAFHNLNLDDD